jgi:hypothetical protein
MLEITKMLLGIDASDTSKDNILNHYLNKAINIILGYCNVDSLNTKYNDTVADFAVYLYKNKDSVGYKQNTEGERSIQYEIGIPANIKQALPLPKIKVGGCDV